ncbi:MAG: DUF4367 domain-containing protein [Tissierellia bacterium]|nr:DUF4367 domain-containing protein [Tissierellia bacterium]
MQANYNDKDKQSEFEDILYNNIGYHYIENINKDIEKHVEDIDSVEIPKSLDNWFLKFNQNFESKIKKNRYKNNLKKFISKVAVVFLVLFISAKVLTTTTDAFKIKSFWIVSTGDNKYIDIKIVDEDKDEEDIIRAKTKDYYLPEYIPHGFKLDSISYIDKIKTIVYTNSINGEIIFRQGPNGTSFRVDTENSKVGDVNIGGWAGLAVSKKGSNTLFWHNDEYSFLLTSSIEKKELIKIAESLIYKKRNIFRDAVTKIPPTYREMNNKE